MLTSIASLFEKYEKQRKQKTYFQIYGNFEHLPYFYCGKSDMSENDSGGDRIECKDSDINNKY